MPFFQTTNAIRATTANLTSVFACMHPLYYADPNSILETTHGALPLPLDLPLDRKLRIRPRVRTQRRPDRSAGPIPRARTEFDDFRYEPRAGGIRSRRRPPPPPRCGFQRGHRDGNRRADRQLF